MTENLEFGSNYPKSEWEKEIASVQLKVDLCPKETRQEFAEAIVGLVTDKNLTEKQMNQQYLVLIQSYLNQEELKKSFKRNPARFLKHGGKMVGQIGKNKTKEILRLNK